MRVVVGFSAALLAGAVGYSWLLNDSQPTDVRAGLTPGVRVPSILEPEAAAGAPVYARFCADCHGSNADGGTGRGPPLVHALYSPAHLADAAIGRAVRDGAAARYWTFGDMPATSGIGSGEVDGVVAYVRALQRANGID